MVQQSKEARRVQQSHDPNYLKDSPKSPAKHFEDVPPIHAIDLGVPLHIPGLATTDQVIFNNHFILERTCQLSRGEICVASLAGG